MRCPACGSRHTLVRFAERGADGRCSTCEATWKQRGSDVFNVKLAKTKRVYSRV